MRNKTNMRIFSTEDASATIYKKTKTMTSPSPETGPWHKRQCMDLAQEQQQQLQEEQQRLENTLNFCPVKTHGENCVVEGLGNSMVLNSILDYLPYEDVRSCALVRKNWRPAVTQKTKSWKLFKLFIQCSSCGGGGHRRTDKGKNDDSGLILKIGDEKGPDMPSKYYMTISIEKLQEKLGSVKKKKVIWVVLNFKSPSSSSSLSIMNNNNVDRLFNLIRPWVTRLIVDGCPPLSSSSSYSSSSSASSSKFMLLDSPNLRHIYFRGQPEPVPVQCKQSINILPQMGQVRSLRFQSSLHLPAISTRSDSSNDLYDPFLLVDILGATQNVAKIFNFPLHSIIPHLLTPTNNNNNNSSQNGVNGIDSYYHDDDPIMDNDEDNDCEPIVQALLGKVKSISYQLRLSSNNNKNSELALLCQIGPQLRLETLVMTWSSSNTLISQTDFRNCYKIFSTILHSSRDSLHSLEIRNSSFVQHVQIPILPALTTLRIVLDHGVERVKVFRYFPPPGGFNLSQKMPNLSRLEIEGLTHSLDDLNSILPPDIFHPGKIHWSTVRHLKIRDHDEGAGAGVNSGVCMGQPFMEILQRLALYFPQIQSLDVGQGHQRWLEQCLPVIWTFWFKLKELSVNVHFPVGQNGMEHQQHHQCLDEVITGIPEEKCKQLRQWKDRRDIDIKEYRSLPAISNMKNLKRLSISFTGGGFGEKEWSRHPILSQVSTFYGFQLVPGLEVNLTMSKRIQKSFIQELLGDQSSLVSRTEANNKK